MKNGFTLVELSIVLVMIGLLIGGILVGQSLISTVEKRRMFSELQQIEIMIDQFESRFRYLPGDAPNAYKLFGSACGADSNSPSNGNCNGNGDGQIEQYYNTPNPGGWSPYGESGKAWGHLRLAGFIKNNESLLSGNCIQNGATGCRQREEDNAYKYDDDNLFAMCVGWYAGNGSTYNTHSWGITVAKTKAKSGGDFYCSYSIQNASGVSNFNAQDILEFDKKYDDGSAITGDVMVASNALVCVVNSAREQYDLSVDTENDCHLVYLGGRR